MQQVCRYQPSCQGVNGQEVGLTLFGENHWGGELQSLQPHDGPANVHGYDSPVGGLGGQGPFGLYSQLLEQFPGYCGEG